MSIQRTTIVASILFFAVAPKTTAAPIIHIDTSTKEGIRQLVEIRAKQFDVDPKLAYWIIAHESSFDPSTVGDIHLGVSRGLWQINRVHNPQVSDECAFDTDCSTQWAMKQLANNRQRLWSSVKFCKKWYKDCPELSTLQRKS